MNFRNFNDIERIWENIRKHEGEIFFTVARKKPYTYTIKDDYLIIENNCKRGRITKEMLENALRIANPSPSQIGSDGFLYFTHLLSSCEIHL